MGDGLENGGHDEGGKEERKKKVRGSVGHLRWCGQEREAIAEMR